MTAAMPTEYVDAFFRFFVDGTLDESIVLPTVADVTGPARPDLRAMGDRQRRRVPRAGQDRMTVGASAGPRPVRGGDVSRRPGFRRSGRSGGRPRRASSRARRPWCRRCAGCARCAPSAASSMRSTWSSRRMHARERSLQPRASSVSCGTGEVGVAVVEAAGGAGGAGVGVDRLQRGRDGGLLGDRRGGGPGLVGDARALHRPVVVLDRAAHARLVDELDQSHALERAHVVGDGARATRRASRPARPGWRCARRASRGCGRAADGSSPSRSADRQCS